MLEILWMQRLGILFGSTSYAAAVTLAVFFFGMAVGSHYWGRYSRNSKAPLKLYGLLEVAVALSALLFIILWYLFSFIYDSLFSIAGNVQGIFLFVKSLLALLLIFPAAFFMGGTLPAMGQFLVVEQNHLAKTASALYAINTFGAALGAFVTGFVLYPLLGFSFSYYLAIGMVCSIGIIGILIGHESRAVNTPKLSESKDKIAPWIIYLSFFSGFISLALQVLWTRMFAQVLHNSVYTYALILVMFLSSLAIGATIANRLILRQFSGQSTLFFISTLSGLAVALSPFIFYGLTGGLNYVGEGQSWLAYLLDLSVIGALSILVPGILMGSLYPYLFRFVQQHHLAAGHSLGQLNAFNTLGAIIGSLMGGFILLNFFGLWPSIRLMSLAYFLLALLLFLQLEQKKLLWVPFCGIILLFTFFDSARLPYIRIDPINKQEALLESWQGATATVAVVQKNNSRQIKVNNYYTLGSTRSQRYEERQAHLPLFIHPQPKSVYFIGLGTGITAGAALNHPIENLVVTELIPEVQTASRKYFADKTHGLHTDKRAHIIAEDGRNFLRASRQKFDVIVADLFVPWRQGIGSVYSLEHFTQAKKRLNSQGIFAQWLPLYQLTYAEFAIITKTFLQVFPNTQLWRGDFFAEKPIVALVGYNAAQTLDLQKLKKQLDAVNSASDGDAKLHLLFYAGNLGNAHHLFEQYGINTDDNRLIEYKAPQSHRQVQSAHTNWFVGKPLIEFYAHLLKITPPQQDSYFSQLSSTELDYISAGFYLQQYKVLRHSHEPELAQRAFNEFKIITGIDQEIK